MGAMRVAIITFDQDAVLFDQTGKESSQAAVRLEKAVRRQRRTKQQASLRVQ